MILPLIVVPVVSLMTKPPKKELLAKAFGSNEASARSESGN